jgi:murein DD-endopeptidase MepM/ murein hydrolase activator NlpD
VRVAFALIALLLAAACGSGSQPAAAPPVTPTSSPTASPTASPTPSPTPALVVKPTHPPSETTLKPVAPSQAPAPTHTAARYVFPIRGCTVSYGHSHHDYPATDMFAAKGCAIVATTSGRIDEVSTKDVWNSSTNRGSERGGISYSLVGDDGVRYYGSHLSALYVRAGQRVTAGQLIGRVGNSGDARGGATHQHYGLSWPTRSGVWWVRRGEVYPWPYLDSWRAGGQKSPVAAVAAKHRQLGDVPPCRTDC